MSLRGLPSLPLGDLAFEARNSVLTLCLLLRMARQRRIVGCPRSIQQSGSLLLTTCTHTEPGVNRKMTTS